MQRRASSRILRRRDMPSTSRWLTHQGGQADRTPWPWCGGERRPYATAWWMPVENNRGRIAPQSDLNYRNLHCSKPDGAARVVKSLEPASQAEHAARSRSSRSRMTRTTAMNAVNVRILASPRPPPFSPPVNGHLLLELSPLDVLLLPIPSKLTTGGHRRLWMTPPRWRLGCHAERLRAALAAAGLRAGHGRAGCNTNREATTMWRWLVAWRWPVRVSGPFRL